MSRIRLGYLFVSVMWAGLATSIALGGSIDRFMQFFGCAIVALIALGWAIEDAP